MNGPINIDVYSKPTKKYLFFTKELMVGLRYYQMNTEFKLYLKSQGYPMFLIATWFDKTLNIIRSNKILVG